ncbi:hypothetical protein [Sabulibacter ruber]|uniref:hypothetical protein n=1 Tax=Sabulibacter ruber TaxID=2811901 RepID=UPI001A95878A|nr:hypothetical protein [Sabulibacter ruber]
MRKSKKRLEVVGQSKEDYFDRVNYVRTVAGMRNVLTDRKKSKVNTNQEVTFRGLSFGATIKEAKKLLGRPELHINKEQEVVGHEVLFYFSSLGSVKVTQCLHFLHGKFIMGQSIVKTSNSEKRKAFCESILEKYGVNFQDDLTNLTEAFPVCDQAGNRIELLYAFDLTITYVTGDPQVLPTVAMVQSPERARRAMLHNAFRERVVQYV